MLCKNELYFQRRMLVIVIDTKHINISLGEYGTEGELRQGTESLHLPMEHGEKCGCACEL